MQAPQWLLAALEQALAEACRLDPEGCECFASLADKVIAVRVSAPPLQFYLLPHPHGVNLLADYAGTPDASLQGGAFTLLRLLLSHDHSLLSSGAVLLEGDTGSAQRLMQCLSALDLDGEDLLARVSGDAPAHWLARLARDSLAWGRHGALTAEANLGEYLREEWRLTPGPDETQALFDDIDTLRADSDRLEQRLSRLERRR